jgi:hypothetical protein
MNGGSAAEAARILGRRGAAWSSGSPRNSCRCTSTASLDAFGNGHGRTATVTTRDRFYAGDGVECSIVGRSTVPLVYWYRSAVDVSPKGSSRPISLPLTTTVLRHRPLYARDLLGY